MKIFPGMHYTMGGLWVDYKQATNIPGIFAAGEAEYQYHGANRLGANSLVSCIFGGFVAGPNAVQYARTCKPRPATALRRRAQAPGRHQRRLMKADGTRIPFLLWRELGELMTENCTVIRYNKKCEAADAKLVDCWSASEDQPERPLAVGEHDHRLRAPALQHAAVVASDRPGSGHARRIARLALQTGFPERDDKNWMKTTKAYFAPDADEPKFEFEPVDASLIPPRPRKYEV
jgi:succinate dehydrogenase / fumarate reductase flavoprotein subunit